MLLIYLTVWIHFVVGWCISLFLQTNSTFSLYIFRVATAYLKLLFDAIRMVLKRDHNDNANMLVSSMFNVYLVQHLSLVCQHATTQSNLGADGNIISCEGIQS